jgi:hypothetical protein
MLRENSIPLISTTNRPQQHESSGSLPRAHAPAAVAVAATAPIAPLLTQIAGSLAVLAVTMYWCASLTGPVPALMAAVGDRDACSTTLMLALAPIVTATVIAAQVRRWQRTRAMPRARIAAERRRSFHHLCDRLLLSAKVE